MKTEQKAMGLYKFLTAHDEYGVRHVRRAEFFGYRRKWVNGKVLPQIKVRVFDEEVWINVQDADVEFYCELGVNP